MKKAAIILLLLILKSIAGGQTIVHALTTQVTSYYNSTGQVAKPSKIWCQQVAANGNIIQVVDISSANFSSIRVALVNPETNNGTLMMVPYTNTLTTITINVPGGVLITYGLGGAPSIGIPTLFNGTVYNVLVLGD